MVGSHSSPFVCPQLIGREQQLAIFTDLIAQAKIGSGAVALVAGEAGTGKTAVAEALAQRIAKNDVPESLRDKEVVSLDLFHNTAKTLFEFSSVFRTGKK